MQLQHTPSLIIRPTFLLFGDSLTQRSFSPEEGWGAALASAYCRKADVLLRGYGGYTSRWALFLLDAVLPKNVTPPPALVTVWFGANDASLPDHISARQHVPLQEYQQNLHIIVQRVKSMSVPAIILITPPPVHDAARVKHNQNKQGKVTEQNKSAERTNEVTGQYAAAVRDVAKVEQVQVLDLWTQMQKQSDWQTQLLDDGLHFTPEGQSFVWSQLQPLIVKAFPQLRYESMEHDFPQHEDVNAADPASSLTGTCQASR